jgi:hypothetical protein
MTKFDKIVGKLGWERYRENIFLFVTKAEDSNGYLTCAFPAAEGYDNFDENKVDKQFVNDLIYKICSHTKFEAKNTKWVLPMLVSDYFAHRFDWDNELIWAKIAMKNNSKFTKKHFSHKIEDKL